MNTNAFVNDRAVNSFSADELEEKAYGNMQTFLHHKKVVEDGDSTQSGLGSVMFKSMPQDEQVRRTATYEASRAYFESPDYEDGRKVVQEYRGVCGRSGKQPFVEYIKKKYTDNQRTARDKYDYLMGVVDSNEAGDGRFEDARNAEQLLTDGLQGLDEAEAQKVKARSVLRGMSADLKGWSLDDINSKEDQALDEIAYDYGERYTGDPVALMGKITEKRKNDIRLNKSLNELTEKSLISGVSGAWIDVDSEAKSKMGDAYSPEVKAILRKNYLAARGQKERIDGNLNILESGINALIGRDDWTARAKVAAEAVFTPISKPGEERESDKYKADDENILKAISILKDASPSEMWFYKKSLEKKVDMNLLGRAWTAAGRGSAELFRGAATWAEMRVAAIDDRIGKLGNKIWHGADMGTGRLDDMRKSRADMELFRDLAYFSRPTYYDGDHGFKNGMVMAAEAAPMLVLSAASGIFTAGQSTAASVIGSGAKTGKLARLGKLASNIVKTGTPLVPSYSDAHFREALANNPDGPTMPMLQAATAAGISDAAIDATASLFGLKIGGFLGRTMAVKKGQLALWKKSPLVNGMFGALKTGTVSFGGEFVQEQLQNLTNPAFQDLAGKLHGYDSKIDWNGVYNSMLSKENNETLAWSLSLMAALAAVGGGARHATISEYYKGHVKEMKDHFGLTQKQTDTILMEPDVSKQAKMIEDTISENLRLTFPAKPVTADNTEGVGKLAEEMDKDPGEVLREVNEFAAEHGVPVEDVKVLRDESGNGYEMEVMTVAERKERDEQLSVPKKTQKENSTHTGETESPSTEEMDDAILNVLERRLQELEDMGYPMIREDRSGDGSVFYFDSPLTGDRLEFGSRTEAIGVLAQEWAAIESDKFEKMKNSLVGDTAERLNSIPVRGAEFAMETSLNEEMTIDKMSQKSEAHAESLKQRSQIATDQEEKHVSGSSRVLGVSETRYNPERKITIALQKMYMGADPLDCYEEFSEGMVDVWINSGQLTTEEIIYEIINVEKATGLSVLSLEGVTDPEARRMRAKESWSKLARGWVVGDIKDERLGAKLLSWFRQMLLTFTEGMNFAKDIIRGAKLKHAKDQGKLDAEVMRMLDESVGIDWDAQAERIKRDVAQSAKGNKGELTLVLAGKLPSPEVAKANGDPLVGLLTDVQDAANSAYGKKHRGDVGEYMSETYVDTNDVMKEINEQHGFEYKTPVQMLTDLSNGLRFGMKQYGTPRLTQSVEGDSAKKLPDGLTLYEGYHVNEFGQGEISDLEGLKNFLNKKAIAATKGGEFIYNKDSLPRLAEEIGTWYQEHGFAEMDVEKIGAVILDNRSVSNSIGHYHRNKKTDNEHKQRVTDAFTLVPDVLQNGKLVEYGQQFDNNRLKSFLFVAPVSIEREKCVMAVRVRQHVGQKGRFYLHSVEILENIKEKSRQSAYSLERGLNTGNPTGADQRDVFRVVKKAFSVKPNSDIRLSESVEGAETDMDFLGGLKDPAKETEVDKGYVDNISREKYAKMTPQSVMIDLITKSSEEKANYLKELKYRFISELNRRGLDKMGRYRDPVAAGDQTVRIIDGINIIDIMCQALPGDAKKYLFGVSEERSRIMEAKTNVGRMNAFRRMALKFEKALDIMISKQKRESVERLLKYAKPMITKNQITKGKMTAETQKKISYIEEILSWSDAKWEWEASHIDLLLDWFPAENDKENQAAPSDELVAEMTWKKELVDTFGGFRQRNSHGNYIFTAEQVMRAFEALKSIYTGGREEASKKRESRGIEIEKRRATLLKGSKKPVVGRYSSDTVLSEFNSKWSTNAKNWGRKLLSFDQYLKNLFGLKNAEARRMEEGKYDATDAFNTEEMKRQEEDMVFFKKVIAESLGNIDEWKKVSDFTVARKFAEWEKTKEFDIYLEKFDVMKDVVTQDVLEDALKALEENGKVPEWLNSETEERARATLKQFHEGDLSGDVEFVWLKSAAKDPSKLWISEFEICTLLNHELQECYADNLDAGGWSQNILRKLEEGVSPEARKINDYFLERYDESWEAVNNVYKEMFNLDMPKITNYSPAALESKGGNDTPIDMNTRDGASLDKVGAIKTRVTNSAPVKGKSAWQLYNNHFTQMAYWKTHALYLRDVQAIVMHRDVSRFVKSNYGSDAHNGLLSWIECFRCGGINRNEARNGFSKYVNRLSDVMAQGFLSWNPKTMLRQFPAVSASSIDVDIDFWKGVSFALSKKNETDPAFKDYLKQRVHFGVTPEMKGFENRNKMKPSRVKQFTRAGNEFLGKVDKFFTSFSGRVAYGYYQDKAKNSGLGDKEARDYASKRAVYTMRRTAQPIEAENKSLWENYADGLHKLAFLFKSEPRKNFATAMFAVSLWMNNEISFGKMAGKVSAAALVPGFLNPIMMAKFISAASSMAYYGNMDDPEDVEDVLSYLRSGLMDSVTGIPILGDAVDYAFVRLMNEAFETNMFYNSGTRYLPFQDIASGISSAIDIISRESEDPWKDSVKISRAASMACAMAGVGVDMSGAMTMATRSADQISKVAIGFGETISRLSDSDKALESRIERLGRVAGRNAKIDSRKKKEAMKEAGKAYEISPEAFISSLKEGRLAHGDAVSIVRQKQKEGAPDYLKQFSRLSRNDRRKALMGLSEEDRKKVIELLKKANIPL